MVSEIAVIKQMGKTAQMDTRDDRLTMLVVVMLSSHYLYNYRPQESVQNGIAELYSRSIFTLYRTTIQFSTQAVVTYISPNSVHVQGFHFLHTHDSTCYALLVW